MLTTQMNARTKKLGAAQINVPQRNKIAKQHTKLVHTIVHRMLAKCNEPYEDLYQLGSIGLLKAIERFNPELGNAFSSFAVPYIQGEIQHYLRDNAQALKVPRSSLEKAGRVKRLRKQFIALGREVAEASIASKLGIEEQEWQAILATTNRRLTVSWDELPYEPNIESTSLSDSDDSVNSLYEAMSHLSSMQRYVLSHHYFLGKSIETIAKSLKKPLEEVDTLVLSAISALNETMSWMMSASSQ